jgi:phosphoribosylformimino-5-aminoimidazole carboxamide ribotide isomerase
MGQRDRYQPIETPLSPTSDPVDVVRGLLSVFPFRTLYVADLDAIERTGDGTPVLIKLRDEFPQLDLWVDNGIAEPDAARDWLGLGLGQLVLGSEVQSDIGSIRQLSENPRVILSLDFRGDVFVGPPSLLAAVDIWPRRVIVMTLARVGGGAGPDIERLRNVKARAGHRLVYAAGGVRNASDLVALKVIGVSGALVASSIHDGRLTAADIRAL